MSKPAMDQTDRHDWFGSLDSLLDLSGVFCSGVPDAADRHDDYIAEGLRDDHISPEHDFGVRRLDAAFPDEDPKSGVDPPHSKLKTTR